ncbi:MAG: DUF4445 domain-containing protein [Gammaproteobacteria bacterium]|nr:DUF4445 domain-containing protein [Gammaproteobacteria bacterium]
MAKPVDAQVVFSPSGKRGRFAAGTTVLEAARDLGVDIDSICGGRGLCGRCRVEPVEGRFARDNIVSSLEHLGPLTDTERERLSKLPGPPSSRLACRASLSGDVCIDVPAASQVHQQVVRKDCEDHDIVLDPVVRLHFVDVLRPDIARPEGDLQRLLRALKDEWGLQGLVCEPGVVRELQSVLREGAWSVTVAVRNDKRIVGAWPGFRDRVYGAAVDVGSTTIAVHLCELTRGEVVASAGAMNPQIRFGEDLMSRVSYAMLNPGGAEELTKAVRCAIRELLDATVQQAGIEAGQLLETTLVGNPVMHHLLLGLDPVPLGSAPFALATDAAVDLPAAVLELGLAAGAHAHVLPCIAGYVGADTAAVLLAETPWRHEGVSLIIDVGTNAEILLCSGDRVLAASSPTGPAFEGAQIGNGQRAAPGAIERVRIDTETLEPRFTVVGSERWSDEDGFEESLPRAGITGICGSGIIEAVATMYLSGIVRPDGIIDGALTERSGRVVPDGRTFAYVLHEGAPRITVSQADIRAIQLAKAALHAGARLLMNRMGVDTPDRIRLAGAFGSHIDVRYAMVLGLLPDCRLESVSSAANAAGTGARIALLNRSSRNGIERRAREIEKVETAIDPDFQQFFVEAMAIPHATDPYRRLRREMALPAASTRVLAKRHRKRREQNSR